MKSTFHKICFITLLIVIFSIPIHILRKINFYNLYGAVPKINIKKIDADITIDGILNEPVWQKQECITNFILSKTYKKQFAKYQTEVRLFYDDKSIYFGFTCYKPANKKLVANIYKHDGNLWLDDAVEVFLDTFNDNRSCYYFMLNGAGTQLDGHVTEEGNANDKTWDAIWEGETADSQHSWTAEIKIPFASLRYAKSKSQQVWGIAFERTTNSSDKNQYWPDLDDEIFKTSRYAKLHGLSDLKAKLAFSIVPYALGKEMEGSNKYKTGIDLKISPNSNTNINVTYLPDYGEIEADPQSFSLDPMYIKYLTEKRPFFVEGSELFDTPIELWYSRNMTDILGGVKAIGKIGKTNFAFENIQLRDVDPRFPNSNFGVLRLHHDILAQSNFGITITNRDSIGKSFNNYNRNMGFDWKFSSNNKWTVIGNIATAFAPNKSSNNRAYYLDIEKFYDDFAFGTSISRNESNFYPETGYVYYSGISTQSTNPWIWQVFRFHNSFLRASQYTLRTQFIQSVEDKKFNDAVCEIWTETFFRNGMKIGLGYGKFYDRYKSYLYTNDEYKDYLFRNMHGDTFKGSFNLNVDSWTNAGFYCEYADYERDSKRFYLSPFIRFKLIKKISFSLSATNNQVNYKILNSEENNVYNINEDRTDCNVWTANSRIIFKLSDKFFIRSNLGYNSDTKFKSYSTLFAYQIKPFSWFYLLWNWDSGTGKMLFLKFSYQIPLQIG
jgi:hypothetical protein